MRLNHSMSSSTIEVLLLGSAQDGGFPQFGCVCKNCLSCYEQHTDTDTGNTSKTSKAEPAVSLAVLDHSLRLWWLVDATPQLAQQWVAFAHRLSSYTLAGVVLTHAHAGHYPGILYLGKECMNTCRLPCYASADMHQFLKSNEPWGVLYRNENIVQVNIADNVPFALSETLSVLPRAVRHRADFTDTMSFTFVGKNKRLFFCPDIDAWDGMHESLSDVAHANNILLLDATFYDNFELPGRDMTTIPHPRVTETVEMLIASGAMQSKVHECEVFLIHINHSNRLWTDTELVQKLASIGIQVGKSGCSWQL